MAEQQDFSTPPGAGAVLDQPASVQPMAEAPPIQDSHEELAKAIDEGKEINLDSFCPMCGWALNNDNIVEISDEDKKDFVTSVLGGKRFEKEYPRLGGKLMVTMRSRTIVETQLITDQLEKDSKDDPDMPTAAMFSKTFHYQMLIGLKSVLQEGEIKEYPDIFSDAYKDEGRTPLEVAGDKLGEGEGWGEIIYSIIQNTSRHFEQVVQVLTLRAHDSDFWKAVAAQA